ncbi:Ig-like domain-containing protein [candidate division KSB1 bacterium]|nr:Ig-like domain-containing protein [candidate division KSB1 bacterium]
MKTGKRGFNLLITLLLVATWMGCSSDKQLTSPSSRAQIALNTVFVNSTPNTSKSKISTFSSRHDLRNDQRAVHKVIRSSQIVDRVIVTVINSSNESVVNVDLDIVQTAEGRFAEGDLSIPVNGDQEIFLIDIKAFDDDNLVFAGNTLITLTPGEVRTEPVVVTLQALGGGDVQVTLTWNTPTDQDLHVIDPSNSRIYFNNRTSPTGGTLDFDDTDGFGPENIFWATGTAPAGRYKVQVVYFSGTGATVVTVVIQRSDAQAETFTRTINTEDDTLDITEFTFTSGNPILLSIAIAPTDPTIDVGQTQPFTATGTFSDNSTSDITNQVAWASNDQNVATINSAGLATGVGPGAATIGATQGAISDQTTLTVNAVQLSGATLSNLQVPLVQLNDATNCTLADQRVASLFNIVFNYTDPDGDVTTGTTALVTFTFSPSNTTGSFRVTSPGITGDGAQGTITLGICLVFSDDPSVRVTVSITDAGNRVSNATSVAIQKPEGANSPPGRQHFRKSDIKSTCTVSSKF